MAQGDELRRLKRDNENLRKANLALNDKLGTISATFDASSMVKDMVVAGKLQIKTAKDFNDFANSIADNLIGISIEDKAKKAGLITKA